MPLDPHTWNPNDFVTASILDGDFYLFNGQNFVANGIRFHARRPIYKAYNGYSTSLGSLTNGSWGYTFGTTLGTGPASSVIVDTPGLLGAWFDPNQAGNIRLLTLQGGGGAATSPGGLMLSTSYCLWPANSGGSNFACGFGDSTTPTVAPASVGTFQAANSAHQTCCMCIDLVDSAANRYGPMALNGSGGTVAPVGTANSDGSGWASRSLAHWVSVYSANAVGVGILPAPVTNWTTSTGLYSSTLNGNTGFRGPLRFLNGPPLTRAQATSTQNLVANTNTTLNLTVTSGFTSYGSFASNTYTAPFSGLYFVHGYATIGNISGAFKVGVQVNSTTYWGPRVPCPASGSVSGTKTQIFSLNAGDTITLQAAATAAATTGSFAFPRLIVTYLSATGASSPLPTVPDTSFRWAAGTPGQVAGLLNAHVANDLNFLIQKPYLMVYQTAAQNVSVSTQTNVNMDTVAGIVHGDSGDNYGGWSVSGQQYVAKRAGWYLCVEEIFFNTPTLTSTPSVLGAIQLNPHGQDSFDRYQQQNMVTTLDGSGATVVSYYYLRAGDTVTPSVETYDSTSTTIPTSTVENSHFELVWLGE